MTMFKEWAKREYSKGQRFIALIFAGTLFIIIIPLFVVMMGHKIDKLFNFYQFSYGLPNFIFAVTFIGIGLLFGIWAVCIQFTLGHGTPVPMMPTQRLIIQGPFKYSRNPMTLGDMLFYLGIAIYKGSISALGLVLLLIGLLMIYNKFIEERELEERFGSEYLEYKKKVPFLLPRLWKRKH